MNKFNLLSISTILLLFAETNDTFLVNHAGASINYRINSSTTQIDNNITGSAILAPGEASKFINKLGVNNSKPFGPDNNIEDWAVDTNYLTGSANIAFILAGYDNVNNQLAGVISASHSILYSDGSHGTINGGSYQRIINGDYGTINGGILNLISGNSSTIVGGRSNSISSDYSTIVGGKFNEIGDKNSVLSGEKKCFIGGGTYNKISNGIEHSILAGTTNKIDFGSRGFIGGGESNQLLFSDYASILNGTSNSISGDEQTSSYEHTIMGGKHNKILFGSGGFIGGGNHNKLLSAHYSSILSGVNNEISSNYSTSLGGSNNKNQGAYSLTFGVENEANKYYSSAIGYKAKAETTGAHVEASRTIDDIKGSIQSIRFSMGEKTNEDEWKYLSIIKGPYYAEIPENSAWFGKIYLLGMDIDTGKVSQFEIKVGCKRLLLNSAELTIDNGNNITIGSNELNVSLPEINIKDTGFLRIKVYGVPDYTIHWSASFYGTQTKIQ